MYHDDLGRTVFNRDLVSRLDELGYVSLDQDQTPTSTSSISSNMYDQDSGYSDLEQQTTSLTSDTQDAGHTGRQPPSSLAMTDIVNSKKGVRAMVAALNDARESSSEWPDGVVFSRKNFAMSIVGKEGAILRLPDNSATLDIPSCALDDEKVIYFWRPVRLDIPRGVNNFIPYTPMYHCGPEGTTFNSPVTLTFGHCAKGRPMLQAMKRKNEDSDWSEVCGVVVSDSTMTVSLSSFSDIYGGSSGAEPRAMRLVTLLRRQESGGMTLDVYLLPNITGFIQDVLVMLHSAFGGQEIAMRVLEVASDESITLRMEEGPLVPLRDQITFTEAYVHTPCHAQFVLNRPSQQVIERSRSNSSVLGRISLNQAGSSIANITIYVAGHDVGLNSSQQQSDSSPSQAQSRPDPHAFPTVAPPPNLQVQYVSHFASFHNLRMSDGRREAQACGGQNPIDSGYYTLSLHKEEETPRRSLDDVLQDFRSRERENSNYGPLNQAEVEPRPSIQETITETQDTDTSSSSNRRSNTILERFRRLVRLINMILKWRKRIKHRTAVVSAKIVSVGLLNHVQPITAKFDINQFGREGEGDIEKTLVGRSRR